MSECDCKDSIESKIKDKFAEEKRGENISDLSASLNGYGMVIINNTLTLRPSMPIAIEFKTPLKTNASKMKRTKKELPILFSFCPFCGVSLDHKLSEKLK